MHCFGSAWHLAAVMAACGPLIARFYGEPRLTWIAAISSLTFVVSALSSQHNTLFATSNEIQGTGCGGGWREPA